MRSLAKPLPMLLALLLAPGAYGAMQAEEPDDFRTPHDSPMPVWHARQPAQPAAGITEAVIRQAVRETIAEDPRPLMASTPTGGALSGGPNIEAHMSAAFDAAKVPDCLHGDALKHQPAHIGPIAVGGIYSLPWVLAAVVRGKCN